MKISTLTALVTTAILAGCGGVAVKPDATSSAAEVSARESAPGKKAELDGGVMYNLLVGEMALQRGQPETALEQYLAAARDTKNLGVIERATRIADFLSDGAAGTEMARMWLERDPKNLEARQFLANGLMRTGDTNGAVHEIEFILLVLADDRQSYFRIASQLSREKNQDAALEVMDKLVRRHADEPYANLAYAQLATRFERLPLSLTQIDAALRLKPNWADALVLRAHILQMLNKTDEALRLYTESLSGELSGNFSLRMSYARLLLELKRFNEAYEQYTILAKDHPDNDDVIYAAALLSMQTNHNDQAEKLLLQMLKMRERTAEATYYLGQLAEKNNRMDEALDWYDQVGGGEFYVNARMRKAAIMARQGMVEEALRDLRSVKTSSPQEIMQLYMMEGDIYLEAGRHQKAYDIYDRALKDMPDNSNLLYARALAAEKLDRLDVTERDLRDILKADPNNVQALNALGYTLADRTTRYQEALMYIQRALALEPKDAAVIDSMGWVQYRLGNHGEAIAYLRRALDLTPDGEIAAHLGEVLWVTGKKDEAVDVWNRALKNAPDNKLILNVMRRFGL